MFTLSQVLSNSHTAAVQAWEKGAPKAESVSQARKKWAPFLSTWATYIQGNFLGSLTHRVGRERIGWIDQMPFWTAFWAARGNNAKVQQQSENEQVLHMTPYIEGAAAAGSMSFFATMPAEIMGIVRTIFLDTTVLLDPRVMQWYQDTDPLCNPEIIERQACLAKTLEWGTHGESRLVQSRGALSPTEQIDIVRNLGELYEFNNEYWCNAIGHLMLALPKEIERRDLVVQIQQRMGSSLPPGVDVFLVALCSGYDVGNAPTQTALAELGRHLVFIEDLGAKGTITPEAARSDSELLAMLSSLEAIERPKELYAVAMAMGLHCIGTMQDMPVDSQVFGSIEP